MRTSARGSTESPPAARCRPSTSTRAATSRRRFLAPDQAQNITPSDLAKQTALLGGRYNSSIDHGHGQLRIALPVPKVGGALLTYSPLPELQGQLGIVHRQVIQAALFASLAGAIAGLLVAMLIAGRLRRIAHAADAIENERFDTRLHPWLKDELGGLAETIDRMRARLRESFGRVEAERAWSGTAGGRRYRGSSPGRSRSAGARDTGSSRTGPG